GGSLGRRGAGVQPFHRVKPPPAPQDDGSPDYLSPAALDTTAPVPAPTAAPTGPATTAPAMAPVAARWVVVWPQAANASAAAVIVRTEMIFFIARIPCNQPRLSRSKNGAP